MSANRSYGEKHSQSEGLCCQIKWTTGCGNSFPENVWSGVVAAPLLPMLAQVPLHSLRP